MIERHPTSRTRTILYFLTAVILTGILIRIFLLDSFSVIGNSMAPTIIDGDHVFVNKIAYWTREPERYDIVVGNFRGMEDKKAIKRVIGMPGEWIFIQNGLIETSTDRDGERTRVGEIDKESYAGDIAEAIEYRLDPYEYFVIGDNGLTSIDSRELGPVDSYRIDGKVIGLFRLKDLSLTQF